MRCGIDYAIRISEFSNGKYIMKTILNIVAGLCLLGMGVSADATTIDVELGTESSVDILNVDEIISWPDTTISADLADLTDYQTVTTLDDGESLVFDLFTLTIDPTILEWAEFDISATIDFDSPDISSVFTGSGGYLSLFGTFFGGELTWDPSSILYETEGLLVELENLTLSDFFLTDTVTVQATITNVGVASVPEPSTLALLSIGLLGIGFSRRRKGQSA